MTPSAPRQPRNFQGFALVFWSKDPSLERRCGLAAQKKTRPSLRSHCTTFSGDVPHVSCSFTLHMPFLVANREVLSICLFYHLLSHLIVSSPTVAGSEPPTAGGPPDPCVAPRDIAEHLESKAWTSRERQLILWRPTQISESPLLKQRSFRCF